MSIWRMTLRAIEDYLNAQNDSIFKDITLPTGMDKNLLTDTILFEGEEFACIYQDGYYLKAKVTNWFNKNKITFDKWWSLWNEVYNPLENYAKDATIEDKYNDERNSHGKQDDRGSVLHNEGNYSKSLNENVNTNEEDGTDDFTKNVKHDNSVENENKVSAYDSASYAPKDKSNEIVDENTVDNTDNVSSKVASNSATDNLDANSWKNFNDVNRNANKHEEHEKGNHYNKHTEKIHGNIGTTLTQTMYREENSLREELNPYSQITDLFLTEFTIMVL